MLESTVRARLLYAAQTELLSAAEHAKLESVWHQFLRKMIKTGFQRKNAPPRETKKQKAERLKREAENPELKEKWDWGYKITNEKLRKISVRSRPDRYSRREIPPKIYRPGYEDAQLSVAKADESRVRAEHIDRSIKGHGSIAHSASPHGLLTRSPFGLRV